MLFLCTMKYYYVSYNILDITITVFKFTRLGNSMTFHINKI